MRTPPPTEKSNSPLSGGLPLKNVLYIPPPPLEALKKWSTANAQNWGECTL